MGNKIEMALSLLKMIISTKIPEKVKEVSDVFLRAIDKAHISGRLLGLCLALKYPFCDHTISLVGFSLGTQVVKSCLEEMHILGANDII